MYSILLLFLTTGYVADCQVSKNQRIFNGNIVNITDYPYQLSLQYNFTHVCGASIISPNWALTTSLCLFVALNDQTKTELLTLRAGSSYTNSGGTVHNVLSTVSHPKSFDSVYYNAAVIKVSPSFKIGQPDIDFIKVSMMKPPPGTLVTISGWGKTAWNESVSPVLLATDLKVINQSSCNSVYNGFIQHTSFCADGKVICIGDLGNPLVLKSSKTLVGLTLTSGSQCTDNNIPTVFMSTADVRVWIYKITGV